MLCSAPSSGIMRRPVVVLAVALAVALADCAGIGILIDTGDWRQSQQGGIEYLDDHDIDRIDHFVVKHAHADHIGGSVR